MTADDLVRLEDDAGEGLYVRPSDVVGIYKAGDHTYVRISRGVGMFGLGSDEFVRPVRGTPDEVRAALLRSGSPR